MIICIATHVLEKKENSRWLASYNLSFYHCLWHIHGQVISQELEHIFKTTKNHKFSHMIDFSNNSTVWIWKNQTKKKNRLWKLLKKFLKPEIMILLDAFWTLYEKVVKKSWDEQSYLFSSSSSIREMASGQNTNS